MINVILVTLLCFLFKIHVSVNFFSSWEFQYKDLDEEFLSRVTENTRRYIGIFSNAVDELMPKSSEAFTDDDHDILMTQRTDEGGEGVDGSDPLQKMPPEIKRY